MPGFKKVEGAFAVILKQGVYKQVDVYLWQGYYFVEAFGGFISLNQGGHTSHPKTTLRQLCLLDDAPLASDTLGRLCTDGTATARDIRKLLETGKR